MKILSTLDEIEKKALHDEEFRQELLATRDEPEPVSAFCERCREHGYEVYEIDLIESGEEFHAEMKRSTNGGGENSPMLAGEDDFYGMLMANLENV